MTSQVCDLDDDGKAAFSIVETPTIEVLQFVSLWLCSNTEPFNIREWLALDYINAQTKDDEEG